MSDGVSNHQPHDCLLNRLFGRRSKKASKLRITGLCVGTSPGTCEIPAQIASNAKNVSIWWRHHGILTIITLLYLKCFRRIISRRSLFGHFKCSEEYAVSADLGDGGDLLPGCLLVVHDIDDFTCPFCSISISFVGLSTGWLHYIDLSRRGIDTKSHDVFFVDKCS